MTLLQVTAAFGFAFKAFGSLFNLNQKGRENILRYVGYAIGALVVFLILFVFYRWYAVSREQTAQKIFSEHVVSFDQAKSPEQFEALVTEFKSGHDQYSGSHLAPYFTAYEVDALLKLGKKTEVLTALDGLIASLSSSNPLINLYKTKRALLKFDMDDAAMKEAGLKELQQLAQDKKNKERDQAQFYLGLHYYVVDNISEAKKVWAELLELSEDAKNSSPWAQQAKQRLESLA